MKIRLRYAKTEIGRYLSHLDLARTMERTLRRAEVPLAFSEGFNPHPKMSFASALAVGITGESEYLDIELQRRVNQEKLAAAIVAAMPPALSLLELAEVAQGGKSLSAMINLAEYSFAVSTANLDVEEVSGGIAGLLAASEVWRQPKNKPGKKPIPAKEVRPLIRDVRIIQADATTIKIVTALSMFNTGQLRPQEIWQMIAEFGSFESHPIQEVCRLGLYIEREGRVFLPMGGECQDAQRNIDEGRRC